MSYDESRKSNPVGNAAVGALYGLGIGALTGNAARGAGIGALTGLALGPSVGRGLHIPGFSGGKSRSRRRRSPHKNKSRRRPMRGGLSPSLKAGSKRRRRRTSPTRRRSKSAKSLRRSLKL